MEQWGEFSGRFIVDWKRIRSQIEHEDTLVHYRISWLLTFNGFLLAGFFVGVSSLKENASAEVHSLVRLFFCLIPLLGIISSASIWQSARAAVLQIAYLNHWWIKQLENSSDEEKHHSKLIFLGNSLLSRLNASLLPAILLVAWTVAIVFVASEIFTKELMYAIGLFVVAVVFILIGYYYGRTEREIP
jgi:hypothetical protein